MILSYNDVVLRRSDLDILSGPRFLNDRLIEFYFSYLTSCYPSPYISLVPPSIAFWIMNCPDTRSLRDFIEPTMQESTMHKQIRQRKHYARTCAIARKGS